MPAFDAHRPPERSVIDRCVHCGFCLDTCPTYVLWANEADSPRGRIVLAGEGLEGESTLSPEMATHFDRCLGCMACVTACPSGVRYDLLLERVRPQVERHHPRSVSERGLRRLLFETLPHPRRLRLLAPLLSLARGVCAEQAARGSGSAGPAGAAPGGPRFAPRPRGRLRRGSGPRRAPPGLRPALLLPRRSPGHDRCAGGRGFEVIAPREPDCCGALELTRAARMRPCAGPGPRSRPWRVSTSIGFSPAPPAAGQR